MARVGGSERELRWSEMDDSQVARCRKLGLAPADYPGPVAEDWPELLEIVERTVKPERDLQKREALRERWWQYADKRPGLRAAVSNLSQVVAINCGATPHMAFTVLPTKQVWANTLAVIADERPEMLGVLQSRVHETWTGFFASSLEDRLRYGPSDCFETFPLPPLDPQVLKDLAEAYHAHRAALMVARNEGMTKTYNRFHDPSERAEDIRTLRELHHDLDGAVLRVLRLGRPRRARRTPAPERRR